MSFPLVSSLVLSVALASLPGRAVQVETRDGRTISGQSAELRDGALQLDTASGPVSVALEDLLLLAGPPSGASSGPGAESGAESPAKGSASPAQSRPSPPAADPPDLLFLASPDGESGDRLVGRVVGGDTFGLRFAIDGGAAVDVPFEEIERLLPAASLPVDRLALLEGGGADDRVWRRGTEGGLDSLTGVVAAVDGSRLTFESALGPLDFALPDVLAVVFASSPAGRKTLPGAPVVVRLTSGTRLHAGLLALDPQTVTLSSRLAERLELPASALASLVHAGLGNLLLADLVPVEVDERPSIGGPEDFLFPWRADLSVTGRPLSVGGVLRATGLGVHSNSRLAFELPAGVTALRVTVGLCDEVTELPARGSVRFEVLVDGVQRAASGVVREGDPPVVLRVDGLDGAQRLELVVDDAGDDDAADRAAWVDGVLLTALP